MTLKEQLLKEIEQSPDLLVEEVLNFLLFTKSRQQQLATQTIPKTQSKFKPIWEVADEIIASLPEEAINELPTDGATQHDHYLYGTPKRP